MKWYQKLLDGLKSAGLIPEGKESEIVAAFESADPPPSPAPNPGNTAGGAGGGGNTDDIDRRIAAAVQAANKPLLDVIDAEKKLREDGIKTIQEQQKQKRAGEIETVLTEAVAKGKITPEQKDTWKARLESNYDEFKATLDERAETVTPAGSTKGVSSNAGGTGGEKTYDSKFARSIPKEFMEHVEKSTAP